MRGVVLDRTSQPIKNLVRDPVTSVFAASSGLGTGNFTSATVAAGGDGPLGGKTYRRITLTGAFTPPANGDTCWFGTSGHGVSTFGLTCPVTRGRPYTMAIPVRCSVAQKVAIQAQAMAPAGGAIGSLRGPDVVLVPNVWTLLSVVWTPTALDCVGVRVDVDIPGSGPALSWAAGNTLDVGRPFVYEGTALPAVMSDGDTPGWRWLGAAGGSESAGYPYTLEGIAGAPAASLSAPGTVVGTTDPMKGRTLATVVDVVDLAASFNVFARTGDSAAGILSHRTRDAGGADLGIFYQWPTGTTNGGRTLAGIRTPGRHVLVSRVNDGLTEVSGVGDAALSPPGPVIGGTGFTSGTLLNVGSNASQITVQAHMWDEDLGVEGIRRVQAWLARRYGAPVPAGY